MLQAKWLGISIVLHLALLCVMAPQFSRAVQRTPRTVELVLDNLAVPEPSQAPVRTRTATTAVQPTVQLPVRRSEAVHPAVHPISASQPLQNISVPEVIEPPRPPVPRDIPATVAQPVQPVIRPAPGPAPAPQAADPVPSTEHVRQRYLKEHFSYIRDLITGRLIYPAQARRMGWHGKVSVTFTIAEDGSLHDIRVARSSGHPILDKCALETVRGAAPFPRPPVRAEITVPISFSLQ